MIKEQLTLEIKEIINLIENYNFNISDKNQQKINLEQIKKVEETIKRKFLGSILFNWFIQIPILHQNKIV